MLNRVKPNFLRLFRSEITWPMYLHGETGTGKTYAACVIYKHWPQELVEKWGDEFHGRTGRYNRVTIPVREPIFWDCQQLASEVAQRRREGLIDVILRPLRECSLLVLDEIGRREMTGPQLDALLDIVNARGESPMILTSNKSPVELVKVLGDQRIVDRIQGTVVELTGTSQRAAKVRRIKL